MSKLIDADALKKILETKSDILRTGCPDNLYGVFLLKVIRMIDLLPEADGKPALARWEPVYPDAPECGMERCSRCKCEYLDRIEYRKYCGNCGAKMEEE